MKLSAERRAENRRAFQTMKPAEKWDYLYTYYKLPMAAAALALVVLISFIYHQLTYREPGLYVALVNVTVGSELQSELTHDFQQAHGLEGEVLLYEGLTFTEDPFGEAYQYMYASRMKLIAAVESKELDVMLMNEYAYQLLSGEEYLMDLSELSMESETPDALSGLALLDGAGMDGAVYAGVIVNSPRAELAGAYLRYLRDGKLESVSSE